MIFFGGGDAAIEKKRIRRAALFAFCLLVNLFSVLWYTVLKRGTCSAALSLNCSGLIKDGLPETLTLAK